MVLLLPNHSFTIPSVHDGLELQCRLHHPISSSTKLRAVIIAHPYAPLGGCFDDPIVHTVGRLLLKAGFLVATFNFRGAAGAPGKTTWSAKAELADYISFYGFMLYYLSRLAAYPVNAAAESNHGRTESYINTPASAPAEITGLSNDLIRPMLILGGYSYGSMIASRLPSLKIVREFFSHAKVGSAEAEIFLRARNLSTMHIREESNRLLEQQSRGRMLSPTHAIAVGGFESDASSGRTSRDSKQSLESTTRTLEAVRLKLSSGRTDSSRALRSRIDTPEKSDFIPDVTLVLPEICYLLISPLLGPTAAFATMFSNLCFTYIPTSFTTKGEELSTSIPDLELTTRPSLAVYGTKDLFTSHKKVRKWAEQLKQRPGSRFDFREVEGAGHFWHESGVEESMKVAIKSWLTKLQVDGK